jgi:hypothetical protein
MQTRLLGCTVSAAPRGYQEADVRICSALLVLLAGSFAGCATHSGVIVNPSIAKMRYQSAYVVVHGDRSSDMDANLQKELLRHGLSVSVGPETSATGDAQLIVRYADDWKWDMAMYLRSFDVMVFDAHSKTLLATGSWKNSAMHGFHSADGVVAQVVDETFSKLSQ